MSLGIGLKTDRAQPVSQVPPLLGFGQRVEGVVRVVPGWQVSEPKTTALVELVRFREWAQ